MAHRHPRAQRTSAAADKEDEVHSWLLLSEASLAYSRKRSGDPNPGALWVRVILNLSGYF